MKQLKVGITGGIGTGKSTVAKILVALGYPVYFSDDRAKWLMENNQQLVTELSHLLGNNTYVSGKLNRAYIAEKLFSTPALKEKINALVHPVVRTDFKLWVENQTQSIVFQESALLVETGAVQLFDALIVVTAPLEDRIKRIQKRDGLNTSDIERRFANQFSDEEKIKVADFVLINDERSPLLNQVLTVLKQLNRLS
ncbi:MAG: dephospho-CoA kinase [Fluviicola sp.]|nr:dephospho-CoA kinase [Fluviicola sp.]MBP6271622.1 dephospho-CoA kinase [Fluviicola sp.]